MLTGASRLAAKSAQRGGVGYVTLVVPDDVKTIYKVSMESIVVRSFRDTKRIEDYFEDAIRKKGPVAGLIGPGSGINRLRERLIKLRSLNVPLVIDADALRDLVNGVEPFLDAGNAPVIWTPHAGEFSALFPQYKSLPRIEAACKAAKDVNGIIVLKGCPTIIADPEGKVVLDREGSHYLATAGSGDVLAGLITSFLAQGCAAFDSACMGVHVFHEASKLAGVNLIPEDLIEKIPFVIHALYEK